MTLRVAKLCPECGKARHHASSACSRAVRANKRALKQVFDEAAAEEQPPLVEVVDHTPPPAAFSKRSPTGWSPADVEALQTFCGVGLAFLSSLSSRLLTRSREYGMSDREATAIGDPLGRILSRRLKVGKALRGDLADGLACLSAMVAYGWRLSEVAGQHRREQKAESPPPVEAGVSPAPPPRGPDSPQAQAAPSRVDIPNGPIVEIDPIRDAGVWTPA